MGRLRGPLGCGVVERVERKLSDVSHPVWSWGLCSRTRHTARGSEPGNKLLPGALSLIGRLMSF